MTEMIFDTNEINFDNDEKIMALVKYYLAQMKLFLAYMKKI